MRASEQLVITRQKSPFALNILDHACTALLYHLHYGSATYFTEDSSYMDWKQNRFMAFLMFVFAFQR